MFFLIKFVKAIVFTSFLYSDIIFEGTCLGEALDFIVSHILDKDVFNFDPKILNKLSPERLEDFEWKVWRMDRIDYPIHRVIKRIHAYT